MVLSDAEEDGVCCVVMASSAPDLNVRCLRWVSVKKLCRAKGIVVVVRQTLPARRHTLYLVAYPRLARWLVREVGQGRGCCA
jgi:hypothetical protein